MEGENRCEGLEVGKKSIVNLKNEKRKFSMDWIIVCMREGGEEVVINEVVKVSRGYIMFY